MVANAGWSQSLRTEYDLQVAIALLPNYHIYHFWIYLSFFIFQFISGGHIVLEVVHSAMRPLLLMLGDHRNLDLNVIQRLSSLTQLFPNTFNEKLCEQLLVCLNLDIENQWNKFPVHERNIIEPRHDKTNKMSVRPAKTRISLGIGMKKAWVLRYPLSAQRRLWSDWADAQADLNLHWAHMPFCWFCHTAAHILEMNKITFLAHKWIYHFLC